MIFVDFGVAGAPISEARGGPVSVPKKRSKKSHAVDVKILGRGWGGRGKKTLEFQYFQGAAFLTR